MTGKGVQFLSMGEPCGSTLLAHSADQEMVISAESFEFLGVCILVGADLSV